MNTPFERFEKLAFFYSKFNYCFHTFLHEHKQLLWVNSDLFTHKQLHLTNRQDVLSESTVA